MEREDDTTPADDGWEDEEDEPMEEPDTKDSGTKTKDKSGAQPRPAAPRRPAATSRTGAQRRNR